MSPIDFMRSPFFLSNTWVRVKLAAATEVPPHSVVLITTSTITNGANVYTVRQPNAASTDFNWDGYLVTGPFTIGASTSYEGIATAAASPTLARYAGTPAVGNVFGPVHGQFTLERYYYGYTVVGAATTSAGRDVVPVKWRGIPNIIGKIDDASVNAGSSCTVSVHYGSSYQTDSTMNVTGVYNRAVNLTGLSSPYCSVSCPNGVPVLDWVAC